MHSDWEHACGEAIELFVGMSGRPFAAFVAVNVGPCADPGSAGQTGCNRNASPELQSRCDKDGSVCCQIPLVSIMELWPECGLGIAKLCWTVSVRQLKISVANDGMHGRKVTTHYPFLLWYPNSELIRVCVVVCCYVSFCCNFGCYSSCNSLFVVNGDPFLHE